MIHALSPDFAVSPQIRTEDMARIAAAGYRTIVNNRPDREAPDQPANAAIAAAARAAGLGYVEIPVTHTGFAPGQIDALAHAMEKGPVLAFCRSGTRSCFLWALARARAGDAPEAIAAAAAHAGYDLAPIEPMLRSLGDRDE